LGPCLCAARTPLVDRDLADPVIDAFLTGLTSAHPAAPLCYGLSFLSAARLRPLSIACWPGCPNARLGGQNRTALAPGKERARLRRRLTLGCSNCTAV
jgi:hypothetical protein